MSSEASAAAVDLGNFAPLKSTAEIIDFMEAMRRLTPPSTKKNPSTPFDEVWAKDGYVLSDGDCAEWIAKADYGMFFHGDALSFFTKRGDDIVRIVRHAKNHAAPTIARKYTLKISADENSSPEQKAIAGTYATHRYIVPERPSWKEAGKTSPRDQEYRDGTRMAFGGVEAYRSPEDVWERTIPFLDAFCHHVGGFGRTALIEPTQTETQATLNGERWIDPDAIEPVREALIPICRYVLLLSDNLIHHLLFVPNSSTKKADLKRIRNAGHVSSRAGIFDDFLLKLGETGNVIIYKNQSIKERLSIYVSVCEDTKAGDDIETALGEYLLEEDKLNKKFETVAEAKAVGEMFERVREAKGISKKAMERDHGFPRSNIRNFELGTGSPTLERIQKYADALGFEARIELVPKDQS